MSVLVVRASASDTYPTGDSFDTSTGELSVYDKDGFTIAQYAAGYWTRAALLDDEE